MLKYPLESYSVCSEQGEWRSEVRNPLKSHSIFSEQGEWARGSEIKKLSIPVDLLRARRKTSEILTNKKAAIYVQRIFSHLICSEQILKSSFWTMPAKL
jgi:hypothetical protein